MLKEKLDKLQHKHLIISAGAIIALLVVFYFGKNVVLDSVNGKVSLSSADMVASEDGEENTDSENSSDDSEEKNEEESEDEDLGEEKRVMEATPIAAVPPTRPAATRKKSRLESVIHYKRKSNFINLSLILTL